MAQEPEPQPFRIFKGPTPTAEFVAAILADAPCLVLPDGVEMTIIEDTLAPFRTLAAAVVLPALCEAWKARNPHGSVIVDPSSEWAVVSFRLGPWSWTTRLWWQAQLFTNGHRTLGERAEIMLECAWARLGDGLARNWKPEAR